MEAAQAPSRSKRVQLPVLAFVAVFGVAMRTIAADDEISILSYNTHGLLAWIARDDPARRFPLIGTRARAYDLAFFQEVFLEDYYARLGLNSDTGWQSYRGNGPRPGPLGLMEAVCGWCGSGLAGAAAARLSVVSVDRRPFGSCAGKLRGAHDCWATKGILFLRLRLPNGAEIDAYDLHMDAGDRGADYRVRRGQIAVLREEVERRSQERAVIVAGDFNLKQNVDRDQLLLEEFRRAAGLTDARARPAAPHWNEVIDYILFRSGAKTSLALLEAGEALEFVDERGTPLSDHPAVYARFRARQD